MNLPPPKPGYAKHLERLGDSIRDVEHFRTTYDVEPIPGIPVRVMDIPMNVAVVVLNDGACFIGEAKLNYQDTYNRKRGHEIAVGRALKKACGYSESNRHRSYEPLFYVPGNRAGVALRDFCRKQLDQLGVM